MTKVRYMGCSDGQVKWGGHNDPRNILEEGKIYELEYKDIHTWHTRIKLIGIEGEFNSVCFEETSLEEDK